MISRGWYVSGTWLLTGGKYDVRDEPKRLFLFDRGIGAVELAGRFDTIRFGSAEHPGNPSRTPRAANILGNSDRAWTFGLNWYWNRFFKVQFNAVREKLEDIQRTPVPAETIFWMRLVRVQLVL
jgi:phosphate-selective porin OprO/OprP